MPRSYFYSHIIYSSVGICLFFISGLSSLIFPIAKYGAETWSISKQAEKIINAFENKCYRNFFRVPWADKRTNVSTREQLHIKEETELLNAIKKHKMKYFGHVKRHDCLEKDIFEGIIEGKRGRGRPRRRWSQDITECLHTTVTEAGRQAQDRTAFRRAVADATCRKASAT